MSLMIRVTGVWLGGALAASGAVDFVHEVVPVLKKHCVECHTDGTYKGSLSMDHREALLGTEKVGEEILYRIGTDDEDDVMPPLEWKGEVRGRMSAEEVAVLKAWVAEGLPWDDAIAFREKGYQAPVLPREVVVPEDTGNGVDWIVGKYFEANGVAWPGVVDDERWLRRASLDLVGLLPPVEEVKAFVRDEDPGKRSKKVVELLGRERDYADHWMTFWNDLLRNDYAGTGFIDGGRKQISKWLYASLVANKRYDDFVRELIAPPDGESEGFIKGIKWRGNVNASQVQEVQFAQNVAQVFLGENLKCASCHDSFIDDWKLDDAYAMAAIVADRELELHRCDKPTGEMAKAGFLFKEVGDVDAAAPKAERLRQTAALMTSEKNGRLARTLVNRLWQRLAGRGIVEPVDIMGNEPWSEDLLDWLAWDLQTNGYDVKRTLGVIASSRLYGSATVEPWRAGDGEYVFRGPVAKRMTAEQFVDAVWGLTGGGKTKIEAPVEVPVLTAEAGGGIELSGMRWIWERADAATAAAPGRVVMRRQFALPGDVKSAVLAVTCDNGYRLSVNGEKVGGDDDWNSVERYEVGSLLKRGENVVQVVATNGASAPNPAGLLLAMRVELAGGEVVTVVSDGAWEVARSGAAAVLDGDGPWGAGVRAAVAARLGEEGADAAVRASLVKSTLLMRALGRPNREQVVTTRPAELTTLQALELNNGAEFVGLLERGAKKLMAEGRAGSARELAEWLVPVALARGATREEVALARSVIGAEVTARGVEDFLWMVLMLPEFQTF